MKLVSSIFAYLLATNAVAATASSSLRGRSLQTDNFVFCRMVIIDTMHENDQVDEELACVPIVNGNETYDLITVTLPTELEKNNGGRLEHGTLYVNITHAELTNGDIAVTPSSEFIVVHELPRHLRHLQEETESWTMGTKTIAFVRVSTNDIKPTVTKQQLENLFAEDEDSINFKTQYDKCSDGKLEWELSDYGVIDVTVDQPMSDFGTSGGSLVTAAQEQLKQMLKLESKTITSIADKVVFCVARGPGTWVASAPMRHWRAQFHDEWCVSLTAMMHELGHTIGLVHSREDGDKYGDTTGNMARSYRNENWPQRCFDGRSNHELGWYADREVQFDPLEKSSPEIINLAGFVDYTKTSGVEEPVLVTLTGDVFIQYNRVKSFHAGSGEMQNMVTISVGPELVAGLGVGDRHEIANYQESGNKLVVEVCAEVVGNTNNNNPDEMIVSVGMGHAACPEQSNEKETAGPAVESNEKETAGPVFESGEEDTVFPTSAPETAFPTSAPSSAPFSTPKGPNRNSAWYQFYNRLHRTNRNDEFP